MDKVLLVLPPLNAVSAHQYEPNLGYAHGIISHLVQISNLTVLLLGDADVRRYDDYLNRYFGSVVRAISLTEMKLRKPSSPETCLIDYRPFINLSLQTYEYISESYYDCVVFDVFDAPGFIPIRAKRTGLGLGKTLLVSWLRTCHDLQRRQVLHIPHHLKKFKLEKQLDFAERYCCENSDLVISHTDTILEWAFEQEWKLHRAKVRSFTEIKDNRHFWTHYEELALLDPNQNRQAHQLQPCPLVSICVAHFNDGQNLEYLLKSLEVNDYNNFEVIVVDDGSTDAESLRIVNSLASKYPADSWRFFMKEENESIGPTRNFAVSRTRGELIIFMDSDNLANKTMISDFVRGMLKSGADCLSCSMVLFRGDGATAAADSLIELWVPLGACVEVGIFANEFGDANFCVRKCVFEALGGFCGVRGEVADDWEFLARLVLAGFVLDVVPKGLFFYRVRSGSWLQSAWSSNSIQALRDRILSNTGPGHTRLINSLLLQMISENEQLTFSVRKLDRKIVILALKLAELISEEHRVLVQELTIRFVKRIRDIRVAVSQFLREQSRRLFRVSNPILPATANTSQVGTGFIENEISDSRFFVKILSDSQRVDKLIHFQLPINRPIFGFFGELSEEKRPLGFLRVAYWMQMSKDDSFFVMLGDGPLEHEVQTTATKYNLRNFKRIPFLDRPEELYALLSGLVITSASEQMPIEMLEALACGIPVFSTNVGQARPVLGQYGSGLVVTHDPERKDFADCFKLWKDNLEIYRTAAMETAELIVNNC